MARGKRKQPGKGQSKGSKGGKSKGDEEPDAKRPRNEDWRDEPWEYKNEQYEAYYRRQKLSWYSHGFGWMWPNLERRVIKKDQRHAGLKEYLAQRERAGLISRQEAGFPAGKQAWRTLPMTSLISGKRIRMSMMPMLMMLLLPWAAFGVTAWLAAFRAKYLFPYCVDLILVAFVLLWLASVFAAVYARFRIAEPTWYTYLCCALGVAVVAGPLCGDHIFRSLTQHYYRVGDLKTLHGVDVAVDKGDAMLDAGIVDFAQGNYLDGMRAWHFKHHTAYCVAPVVTNQTAGPVSGSYDFWAVGKDCCSLTSSDFRCGAWGHPHADRAIRVLADQDVPFYRLAVQQAETLYGLVAANPVFFKWSDDPESEVATWFAQAMRNFTFDLTVAFMVSLFALSCAAYRFSWMAPALAMTDELFVSGKSYGTGQGP